MNIWILKEEIARHQENIAQAMIAGDCSEKGIVSSRHIESRPERLQEIVVALLSRTKLSHRKVAGLLNIDVNVAHRVGQAAANRESQKQ